MAFKVDLNVIAVYASAVAADQLEFSLLWGAREAALSSVLIASVSGPLKTEM